MFAVALGCTGQTPHLPNGFLLGGIQVNEPDMGHWHDALLEASFNTLSLTVYARQGRWDSADIEFDPDQLGGAMVREIRAAKRAGLNVVLILRVGLEHALADNKFLWHGQIQPKSNADLDAWFFRYGEFVRGWAEVAEAEGVDVLGIGSELSSLTSTASTEQIPNLEAYYLDQDKQTEQRERTLAAGANVAPEAMRGAWGETYEEMPNFLDEQSVAQAAWAQQVTFGGDIEQIGQRRQRLDANWRRIIQDARSAYSGALSYAANFDQFHEVGFWDALDVIGVNAYFPLRNGLSGASVSELEATFEASWRDALGRIEAVRDERNPKAPVVFTELGYTSWRGSTIQPWAGDGFAVLDRPNASEPETGTPDVVVWRQQPPEPLERAVAVRALAVAASERPGLLHGLLYWKLSTVAGHRDIEPFVLILGESQPDPLLRELAALPVAAGLKD